VGDVHFDVSDGFFVDVVGALFAFLELVFGWEEEAGFDGASGQGTLGRRSRLVFEAALLRCAAYVCRSVLFVAVLEGAEDFLAAAVGSMSVTVRRSKSRRRTYKT
jgi:hypothetical protein